MLMETQKAAGDKLSVYFEHTALLRFRASPVLLRGDSRSKAAVIILSRFPLSRGLTTRKKIQEGIKTFQMLLISFGKHKKNKYPNRRKKYDFLIIENR